MNSRGNGNEIVNFATDLDSLNQLDVKEPLLTFPFDHLYACHSESGDQSQRLDLDKEVEISTHCVVTEDTPEHQRITYLECENKKLKDLVLCHLDLIQQQNEISTKRDKMLQDVKLENATLKSQLIQAGLDCQLPSQGQMHMPLHNATATITSSSLHSNVATTSENYFDTLNEILSPKGSQYNPYSSDINNAINTIKYPSTDVFDLVRATDSDLANYLSSDLGMPSILEGTTLQSSVVPSPSLQCDPFTMIDNKRPIQQPPKKELKTVDVNKEPKYTVTTNSGQQKIQRNRKRSSGVGSLSRMPKPIKAETTIPSDIYDNVDDAFMNKKAKMTSYGTSKQTKLLPYSGLSDKLQLIDPIPPGADPYQLGEAEMRAQSPIPKLMLQKNHGRMRIFTDPMSGVTSTITSTTNSRRIYDTMSSSSTKTSQRDQPSDTYGTVSLRARSRRESITTVEEPELDVVKTESDIDWRLFTTGHRPKETSLCDFSYGETSANLLKNPLDISKMSFNEIFDPSPVNADSSNVTQLDSAPESAYDKTKKRGARTTSLAGPIVEDATMDSKRASESKRGRKRALSSAGTQKRDSTQKALTKPRPRRAIRGKKISVPGMSTRKLYHTCMGDADLSWYFGLDPDVQKEDCQGTEDTAPNVEVPRWREKPYTPTFSSEGTENLDDKVFEKRHQKLEAEERRQLRWHMRRIREQRHVERLRLRQRDPWSSSQSHPPADYTVWPQPIRDLQFIEITDTLPVLAFGEELPALPEKSFAIPWIRSFKPQKRSKRSKTHH